MTRFVYVNGEYRSYAQACLHVEDRGFLLADAVYEVCEIRQGCLIDERRHIDRLHRSMSELKMRPPMSRRALGLVMRETIRRNRVRNGLIYLQISRGIARRDFAFPSEDTPASIVCFARSKSPAANEERASRGIKVATMPDERWQRVDIKTVGLLPNALARQRAIDEGADEAWLLDEAGYVKEGASCNAWIITKDGQLVTRPADRGILRGITREVLVELIGKQGLNLAERAFTVEEAMAAAEAFNTSATSFVMPVIAINNMVIGDGKPGKHTMNLRKAFHDFAESVPLYGQGR